MSIENGSVVVTPPDLTTKVNSSVSGFVTDENDAPVLGATVKVAGSTTTTDKYGYFEFNNIQVIQTAATVAVSRSGYFKSIKTFWAKDGKSAFFRVKLIPKNINGTIEAASGGTMTLLNGLSVKLPAASVVVATTNAAYTGPVNISSTYLDPLSSEINKTMLGDRRGIELTGAMKLLKNYGIVAIELTGSAGESLQIASGKKATLTIPIPNSMVATASATISFYYFDENTGLWKEEETATKSGNSYTGDVSHFTYWSSNNVISNAVYVDFTAVDNTGLPIPNQDVWVNIPNDFPISWGYTDLNGYCGGPAPENSQLSVTVSICNTMAIYTFPFVTGTINLSLGNLIINSPQIAHLSGTVSACNGTPITNGCVYCSYNNQWKRYNLSNTGSFLFNTVLCPSPGSVEIVAQNLNTMEYSNQATFSIASGNNNLGNIVACNPALEFIYYSIDGVPYNITSPIGLIFQQIWQGAPTTADEEIWAYNNAAPYNSFNCAFTQQNIGTGSIQDLHGLRCTQLSDSLIAVGQIPVHITEFGNVGDHISGNFSGTMQVYTNPNVTHTISCNFRATRNH